MTRDNAVIQFFWLLTAAALNIFVLYAPQPLLPLFADLYGLSEAAAGLLMTVTMLPLALAPLSYGYLLGFIRPIQVLRFSLLLLAVMTWMTGLTESFNQLLVVRFLQGLIIPASLTAVMAFLANSVEEGGSLQTAMSLYVTATISGGFVGRLLAGMSTDFVDWRIFFFVLSGLLAACFFMIKPDETRRGVEVRATEVADDSTWLMVRSCIPVYLAIFCLFFVFCGTLNYLPFRTVELAGTRSGFLTGIMYCGYITGIVTSLAAGKIVQRAGSDVVVMIVGNILFLVFLTAMLLPSTVILFILIFPFCGAMFLVHSIASAAVNRRAGKRSGLASGLYVSSYYGGGILGSYLPGLVFEHSGWGAMVTSLVVFGSAGVALFVFYFRKSRDAKQ